jgi:hypothetical protein
MKWSRCFKVSKVKSPTTVSHSLQLMSARQRHSALCTIHSHGNVFTTGGASFGTLKQRKHQRIETRGLSTLTEQTFCTLPHVLVWKSEVAGTGAGSVSER